MKKFTEFVEGKNVDLGKKIVGRHDEMPDSKFDAKELKLGIKVEREHTNSKTLAKLIAKDHLAELPDYYSRLKKMEKK